LAKRALKKICKDLGHPASMIDEIYSLCERKLAYLYTVSDGDAFAIVQLKCDLETNRKYMFVWACWNHGDTTIITKKGNEYLDELARGMGAKEIRFYSRRKGFERAGWKIDNIIYSRAVTEV